jgi:hypothetical protein
MLLGIKLLMNNKAISILMFDRGIISPIDSYLDLVLCLTSLLQTVT